MSPKNDKELYDRITKGIQRGVARALMEYKKPDKASISGKTVKSKKSRPKE
jgi:hypothetical protein